MNARVSGWCLIAGLLCLLSACDGGSAAKGIASAQALLDKRDVNAAVIELKQTLSQHPQSGAARLLLGRTLLKHGDSRAALQELLRAQEAGVADTQVLPDIARAMLASDEGNKLIAQHRETALPEPAAQADLKASLAMALAAAGEMVQARAAVTAALQAQPGHATATVVLARLDASEGRGAVALRLLDEVLVREPADAAAGLAKGQILLQLQGDAGAALQAFQQVRKTNPDMVAGHAAVLELLIQQNQHALAKSEFEALRKLAPQHPASLALQAQLAFQDKDYAASREITQRLLATEPDNLRMLMLAGAAELQMQHHTLAAGLLTRAVKAAPQWPLARHLLAKTYLGDAQPDKALETLQPLKDSADADATSLALAGEAYLQLGDSTRAEAVLRRALKAAPQDPALRTSLALAQLARGDKAPAMAQLEAIASSDKNTQADLALISARLRQKDNLGALQALDALDKKIPTQAFALTLKGRVLAAQGDTTGAAASFDGALRRQPNFLPALLGLASLDLQAGRPDQARQRLTALLKAEPRNLRAKLALAALDGQLGAPEAVVAAQLREAVLIDPSQATPHRALIEHLLATGDSAGALSAAQGGTAALPLDAGMLELLGRAQLAAGQSQQAVSSFKRLATLQPGKAQHLVRLADAHMASQAADAAEAALRQALALEPQNTLAQRGLALMAVLNKKPQQGIDIARAMQKRQPKDPAGFLLEGELQGRDGKWGAAAIAYASALQRNRSSALAINLHVALTQDGQTAQARGLAADWQKQNPMDAAFAFHLGDSASAAKDYAQAEAQYRRVLTLQPRHAAAMNNIAWLLALQQKPGAAAMAQQANTLLPDRAPFLDTLALALEAENQLPKAITAQKRAVELQPKDPVLRLRLAQLQIKQGETSEARKELEGLARLGENFADHAQVTALLKSL